jgi:hypothetical protein
MPWIQWDIHGDLNGDWIIFQANPEIYSSGIFEKRNL